jgi:hypothetical protein
MEWLNVPLLTAIGTLLVAVVGAVAAGAVLIIKAMHEVSVTTGKIEVAVNSEKTASNAMIASLRNENALLRDVISDKKATAQLLAQSVAIVATKSGDAGK